MPTHSPNPPVGVSRPSGTQSPRARWKGRLRTSRPVSVLIFMLVLGVALTFTFKSAPTVSAGGAKSIRRWVIPDFTSGARGHKLVIKSANPNLKKAAGQNAIDYGDFSVIDADDATLARTKDSSEVEIHDEYNVISLNAVEINTTSTAARELQAKSQGAEKRALIGKQLRLIQFAGPVRDEWLKEVTATGVQIVDYIPNNAYLVYGDQGSLNALTRFGAKGGVQWSAFYEPYLKVSRQVFELDKKGVKPDGYEIQLVADKASNPETLDLIARVQTGRPGAGYEFEPYVNVVANLDGDGLAEVAARPDVLSIQPYFIPKKSDERQDMILAGNLTNGQPNPGDYLNILASWGFTQEQFNASGFVVDVTDEGVDRNPTGADPGTIPQDANAGPVQARHFVLYESGNRPLGATTPTGVSRLMYKGLWGNGDFSNGGLGLGGHGQLDMSIVGGYVPTGTVGGVNFGAFPHADSNGFRFGLGVAPFVRLGNSIVLDPDFTFPNFPNMLSAGYANNARISTNSWGGGRSGIYGGMSQTYDRLVRDSQSNVNGNQQMIIAFAAGNGGSNVNTIDSPGTAKNVITVGAGEGVQAFGGPDRGDINDNDANNANDVASFSARGPCDDGRVKPDIMAPGTHISGVAFVVNGATGNGQADPSYRGDRINGGPTGPFFPQNQEWYSASSGTSHSTPAVSGGAALVYQQFINNPAYIATHRQPAGSAPPTPAMAKGYLMNSTQFMTGVSANDSLPSNNQGMGMMNLGTAFDRTTRIIRDQVPGDTFTATGQSRTFTGTITDAGRPFRVTLAWTDAPGSTTGNAFVNNLDLEVVVNGSTYRGNVFNRQFSVTGGAADPRNNVESVFLPAGLPLGTPFAVRVRATNIAGNGVPGDAANDPTDQDFALVVYNGNAADIPVVSASGQSITSESCAPANGAVDPGETVTVNFTLVNDGLLATNGNLTATLQATGGVTAPSAAQNFGTLGIGGSATRSFSFRVDPSATCGGTVTATLALSDNGGSLSSTFSTFQIGIQSVNFSENFDGVAAPALPANWTSSGEGGTPWTTQASTPDSGQNSVFLPSPDTVSDISLTSPLLYSAGPGRVTFRQNYQMEGNSDGGVLEISLNEGPWEDILGAGGSFETGGYNSNLTATANPLWGRSAWTGSSFGYRTTTVNLPAAANRNFFRLRWRFGSDASFSDVGWRIDSVQVSAGYLCCGQAPAPAPAFLQRGQVVATEAFSRSDSDGFIEPRETIYLAIPLTNIGGSPATSTRVTISTTTPNVFIAQPTLTYGTINPGETRNGPRVVYAPLEVRLASCFAPFTPIDFTATTTYAGGPVTRNVSTFSVSTGCALGASNVTTFSNPAAITIQDNSPASLYPSPVTVSGITGRVTKVTATLNNFAHNFPADADILLVGPRGQSCVLMSDAGGVTAVSTVTYTFDDAAADLLPDTAPSGTYRPTNLETVNDRFPAPGPGDVSPGTPSLSVFNGVDPNGTWRLFVVDDGEGDIGEIPGGWSLNITTQQINCGTTGFNPGQPLNNFVTLTWSPTLDRTRCPGRGYNNDVILNATLTNTGTAPITCGSFQVTQLGYTADGPTTGPLPRLLTADGANCGSGGMLGSIQSFPANRLPLNPGQSIPITFRVATQNFLKTTFSVSINGFLQPVSTPTGASPTATRNPADVACFELRFTPDGKAQAIPMKTDPRAEIAVNREN